MLKDVSSWCGIIIAAWGCVILMGLLMIVRNNWVFNRRIDWIWRSHRFIVAEIERRWTYDDDWERFKSSVRVDGMFPSYHRMLCAFWRWSLRGFARDKALFDQVWSSTTSGKEPEPC